MELKAAAFWVAFMAVSLALMYRRARREGARQELKPPVAVLVFRAPADLADLERQAVLQQAISRAFATRPRPQVRA